MSEKDHQKRKAEKKKRREKRKASGAGQGRVHFYSEQPALETDMLGFLTPKAPKPVDRLPLQRGMVYRLRVTLRGITPPIWRQIEVASDASLVDVAEAIIAVMPWDGWEHLHQIQVGKHEFGTHTHLIDDESPFGPRPHSGRDFALSEVVDKPGAKFVFWYDFGDDWLHDVVVEAIAPAAPDVTYPRVLAGERAAPPEDIGGVYGYQQLLRELKSDVRGPSGPDEDEVESDLEHFDPEAFDLDAAQEALRVG